jgi:hypothetical protein
MIPMPPGSLRASLVSIAALAIMTQVALPLAGEANRQEIIPLGDPVYASLDDLYLEAGFARYSGARPFSAAEFEAALARIPPGRLSSGGLAALELARERLSRAPLYSEGETFAFNGSLSASVEGYAHLPVDDSGRAGAPYAWSYGYEERPPFLSLTAELSLSSFMWAATAFDFKEEYRAIDDRMSPAGSGARRSEKNHLSIPGKLTDLDTFFPFRGAMAIGAGAVSAEFGRDYLDWGNGRTGNLVLSGYTDYYDFLRLAIFSRAFKFSSIFSSFPVDPDSPQKERFLGLTAHRLEFSPWGFLRLTVMEALALGGVDQDIDPIHDLNPVAVYHAWLTPDRTNSMMSAELELSPLKYVNAYAQVALDEFQTPAETEAGSVGKPNALGYLAGLRSSLPLGGGVLRLGYEFVKTDPWLYNRSSPPYYRSQRRIWSFVDPALDEWVVKPIGYEAGPDALVHDAEAAFEAPGAYGAALGFRWTAKGPVDLTTPYLKSPAGATEERAELRLSGGWRVLPPLELTSQLRYIWVRNAGHSRGASTQDMELALGLRSTLR